LKSTGRKLNDLTDTPLAYNLLSSEKKRQASGDRHPLKRVGTPQEIARLALYLLSDASAWLTSQIIHLDGGMSTLKTFLSVFRTV
jgi:NAD(P)-dependent dehydrogenase (short-subunit alcohol dehydrogenase family)